MSIITLTVNHRPVQTEAGRSVLEACLTAGIYIPHLCSHPSLLTSRGRRGVERIYRGDAEICGSADQEFDGCRLCLVAIEGYPEPHPSCDLQAQDGMIVQIDSPAIKILRQQALSRILATHPHACLTCAQAEGCSRTQCSANVPETERCCSLFGNCEVQKVAAYVGIAPDTPRYVPINSPICADDLLLRRDYNLCINCTRCVRACNELRGVQSLNFTIIPAGAVVGTVAASLENSGCKFCTACVAVCPTGALTDKFATNFKELDSQIVPCRAACPAGTRVPAYVQLCSEGRFREAALIVRERAPFPGVLGHVCFHPCEDACKRGQLNEPIAICALKRRASEDDDLAWLDTLPVISPSGKPVAVVGSGPAGLTAAYYLRVKGHDITVYEANEQLGGMLRYGIPEYRLPRQVVDQEIGVLARRGVKFQTGIKVGQDISLEDLRQQHDAVVLALGAWVSKTLKIPGVGLSGIYEGLRFLKQAAQGKLDCDEFAGKRVVVIGGGNVALDCARLALRYQAQQVEVRCLESRAEMLAYLPEIAAAEEEGIVIVTSWGPAEFEVSDGRVAGVLWKRCTQVFDAERRFAPQYDETEQDRSAANAVIIAIGQGFDLIGFEELVSKPAGFLSVRSDSGATSVAGVFAAGDVAGEPMSVIHAIASGRQAAQTVDRYLGGNGEISEEFVTAYKIPPYLGRKDGFFHLQRQEMPCLPIEQRCSGAPLVELGFSDTAARAEAERCLRCSLRLQIAEPILPPELWSPFTVENVAEVPAIEGVVQILNEDKKPVFIKGTADLRAELQAQIGKLTEAHYFLYNPDPMYTKRESELIQQHLQKYGEMPGGAGGDLDDLF